MKLPPRNKNVARYVMTKKYQVGEKLFHPHFGEGVVLEKIPIRKLLVQFEQGIFTLRELVRIDPYYRTDTPVTMDVFRIGI
jgi:hypothetical protein